MSTVSTTDYTGTPLGLDDAPAQRLRDNSAAVRVSFTWFGVRKALTNAQKEQAADSFGAEGEYLSARKKLLDTKHEAFKNLTAVRGKTGGFWKNLTLPYPEPGIRLIRQEDITQFNEQMEGYRTELELAVGHLMNHYEALRESARQTLGTLFNPSDYPSTLEGLFQVEWDWPNVEAPDYLKELNPALFAQEQQRVAARFEEAVSLAENAFFTEFAKLVEHITEKLNDKETGERKVFRDSTITNLNEFFERFKTLNVRSNAQLDELVTRAGSIVQGVDAADLRSNATLRAQVATAFSAVSASIDGMMVNRPRRKIVRGES